MRNREASPRPRYIYFVANDFGLVKIGISARPDGRLQTLRTGAGSSLTLLGTILGTQKDERDWHARFASKRRKGEWFVLDDELKSAIDMACQEAPLLSFRSAHTTARRSSTSSAAKRSKLNGIADRVYAFLKAQHPNDTVNEVAARTGIKAVTLRNAFQRGTAFQSHNLGILTVVYGLPFLNAVCSDDCAVGWVNRLHQQSLDGASATQAASP